MGQTTNKGRDYPLAPTPEPKMAQDKTSTNVNKPAKDETVYGQPKFIYKSSDFNSKDSADYSSGYKYGLNEVSKNPSGENTIGGAYKKGSRLIGINDRYNEGFSEGKDAVLNKKTK